MSLPCSWDEVIDKLKHGSVYHEHSGCIEWLGRKVGDGYGRICWEGKEEYIHRLIFERMHKYLPEVVRHTCDNPACWNIDHLAGGTHLDNVTDKVQKGRHKWGEAFYNAKLTDEKVRIIKGSDLSPPQLAKEFGVHRATIHKILDGTTWKHVT